MGWPTIETSSQGTRTHQRVKSLVRDDLLDIACDLNPAEIPQ
jgi:hypothetical protein